MSLQEDEKKEDETKNKRFTIQAIVQLESAATVNPRVDVYYDEKGDRKAEVVYESEDLYPLFIATKDVPSTILTILERVFQFLSSDARITKVGHVPGSDTVSVVVQLSYSRGEKDLEEYTKKLVWRRGWRLVERRYDSMERT